MMPAGSVNAWKCPRCGGLTVAIHVDQGVTPLLLGCRAVTHCVGIAASAGYPDGPIPAPILDALAWEWTRATKTELKNWRRDNPAMLHHARAGGLVIRPLSDAGRAALAAR